MYPYKNSTLICSYFHANLEKNLISLLPIDHARAFPLTYNVNSKEILKGKLNFYNKPFYANFKLNNFIDSSRISLVRRPPKYDKIVILNLLDNCYGHSLLKLFLAIEQLSLEEKHDFLIIVPRALSHFIKNEMFTYVLELDYSFNEFEGCFILNKEIEPIVKDYKEINIFPIHTYGVCKKENLLRHLNLLKPNLNSLEKRITFYYRKDFARKWNGSFQNKSVRKLFAFLKSYFSENIKFTVVGDRDNFVFPEWISDERVEKYSPENDFNNNQLFRESLIVISITGSHMLLPSLLADSTAHLCPTFKYKNLAEDIVHQHQNSLVTFTNHFNYFGNHDCGNFSSIDLGRLILISLQIKYEKEYKMQDFPLSQDEYIFKKHPYFNYKLVQQMRIQFNNKENKKGKWSYLLNKIRSSF